jgi:hypothetical protein
LRPICILERIEFASRHAPELDSPASDFMDDVHDRGLADQILLVTTGKTERASKISNAGRDHWLSSTTMV